MFSYFWDSELHLAILALAFESFAGLVELGIAIWLASIRREKQTEEVEHRKEKLETAFSLIAAIFFVVAVSVTWRIVVLQSVHEEQQRIQRERVIQLETNLKWESDRADELEAKFRRNLGPWRLTGEQKDRLQRALFDVFIGDDAYRFESNLLVQVQYDRADSGAALAEDIVAVLNRLKSKLNVNDCWDCPVAKDWEGVTILLPEQPKPRFTFSGLTNSLTRAHIEFRVIKSSLSGSPWVHIIVGKRPWH